MKVISLHGTDDHLYELVAPLVMSPEVLCYNNNYPFKTTPLHTWYICMINGATAGFMPIKETTRGLYLDNYYIRDDNHDILEVLIAHVLSVTDKPITVLSLKRHTEIFRHYGFIISTVFAQYNKMQRTIAKGGYDQ